MNPFFDAFMDALDHFFRKRPPLDALMWHLETIAAGKTFVIPTGKIYEVYVFLPIGAFAVDGIGMADTNGGTVGAWFPMSFAVNAIVIGWAPSGAPVRYDADATSGYQIFCTAAHGWEFSEGQVLSNSVAEEWKLMWRDVTHRQ